MIVSRAVSVLFSFGFAVVLLMSHARPAPAQTVAETLYRQDFETAPVGRVPGEIRDDSGWAGGKVLLSLVQTGNPKLGRAIEARVNGFCQLWLGDFSLKAGEPYRVSVDVQSRGLQNLTLSIRQSPEPYTNHGGQDFQTNESPRTLTFVFRALPNGNPARIQIVMRGTTTLTIDNLRVERLSGLPPAGSEGNPLSELLPGKPVTPDNLIPNSSFELDRDGWFQRGPSQFLAASDAPHGRRAVKLMTGGLLFSSWLPLSLRNEYQITAQVKALSDRATVRLDFGDYVNFRGGQAGKGEDFEVRRGDGWKTVRFRYRPPVPPGGIAPTREFYIGLACSGKDAEVLVDAVELRAVGGEPGSGVWADPNAPYSPAAPVEMAVLAELPFGVATVGEAARIRVLAASPRPEDLTYLAIQDEQGRVLRQIPVRFQGKTNEARLTLPNLPPGYWRLVTVPRAGDGRRRIEGEAFVSVVPRMPNTPLDGWHFGTHVRPRADIQAACAKLGWRLNRLHDVSAATKWPTIQPRSGKDWNFSNDEVIALRPSEFALLGNFDQLPEWAPKRGDARGVTGVDLATDTTFPLWREYCRRTAEHFRGTIDTWEVTNEPNLSGMTPEHYVRILQSASEGARAGNPDAKIVGLGGATPPVTEWTAQVLKLGAGKFCDAVSFHNYGGTTWNSEAGPDALRDAVGFVKRALKDGGTPDIPVWDTESGLITQSSFQKFRQPYGDTIPRDGARMMPKAVASVLASGLGRWYFYAAFDATAPGEIAGFTAGDINDTMKMPFQPMAVAIALLEGRAFRGQDPKAKAAGRVDLTFADGREQTRIVWMQPGQKAQNLSVPKNVRVLSHWGRTLPVRGGRITIGQEPVYLISPLAPK